LDWPASAFAAAGFFFAGTLEGRRGKGRAPLGQLRKPFMAVASLSRLVFAEPNAGPTTIGVNEFDASFLKCTADRKIIRGRQGRCIFG
jgi:hypothetical protein